ncbi:ATP-dependent DNA helicase RecG [Bermanella marisrubri]|uniref:ATP-dependent DNA helicase RecG n=1 Tax=Bermanella marisrubri TaxID=207949 RepID=Q1N406_9GAMM|nr:ATP-dependent DNA helicase RecG [Bermanella marisrubri]EAT13059.1 ATP-dependent DNA helicase RecG [Oceanobacter sp. RED65] [Bermanella marisrubri]QIZ82824.1 ATP-dependent DNA helicase RecG [Bermanella marisrubri]
MSAVLDSLVETPVTALKNVGPAMAEKLAKLGIHNVQDLAFHLPLRYQDRTRITPIGGLRANLDVVVEGDIKAADVVFGKRRSLVVRIQDGTGTLTLRFFHFSAAQKNKLKKGERIRCFGEARPGKSGLELYHPEYQFMDELNDTPTEQTLTPIYPSTEGLAQIRWRQLMSQVVALIKQGVGVEDLLPAELLTSKNMPSLAQALLYLHQPPVGSDLDQMELYAHPAQHRLIIEELLAHNLSMQKMREEMQRHAAPAIPASQDYLAKLLKQLPFTPTNAQQRVNQEIVADFAKGFPMLRLVQGDVGSGKTLVAAMAALHVLEQGYQVAIMAPTEILAEQHLKNFQGWMEPLGISMAWLAGKVKGKAREATLNAIKQGDAQLIVGTHALFQNDVEFKNLCLAIIDEQHRFGVHQRLALREKGKSINPHQLIMTATPIPRTLAMSAYADLDTSIIDELPPGRSPVNTVVIDQDRRDQIVERIRAACIEGRQAYWVCTLIEESEEMEAQAAEVTAQSLQDALPELKIGMVHGRLKAQEKADIMAAFKAGDLHLLVATTVIEVGVDVPNASLMVIENPERLGLAQLHQLRGRVGRGTAQSHCVLLYQTPLSQQGKQRLHAMRDTSDGFKIAEIDLQIRGPGEVLGTRQTGLMQMRIADLQRDGYLLDDIQQLSQQLMQQHPHWVDALIQRWLGENVRYGQV